MGCVALCVRLQLLITSPHEPKVQKQAAANRMKAEALLDPDSDLAATQKGHSLTLVGVDEGPVEMLMGA